MNDALKINAKDYLKTHSAETDLELFGLVLLNTIKSYIDRVEELNYYNTQWFLEIENLINFLSVKDHNKRND